ncbi:MAG: hypothetical protein KDB14_18725 [Planctomycetales bacterium]|nr:hypothetical protein [Planctomycetales bacterium]
MFKRFRQIVGALFAPIRRRRAHFVPADATEVRGNPGIVQLLKELLAQHDVATCSETDWLTAENGVRITGSVWQHASPPGTSNLQLDFYLVLDDGRLLIESVGGVGASRSDAVMDGFRNFAQGSLHVLLAALFDVNVSSQVEVETWNIDGRPRRVTIGGMNVRLFSDVPWEPPTEWFPVVRLAIEREILSGGAHWFRCYYAQFNSKPAAVEALLDNAHWPAVAEAMSEYGWPAKDEFYSVRLFAFIQDA